MLRNEFIIRSLSLGKEQETLVEAAERCKKEGLSWGDDGGNNSGNNGGNNGGNNSGANNNNNNNDKNKGKINDNIHPCKPTQFMVVADVKGISMGSINADVVSYLSQSSFLMDTYYPGVSKFG